MLLFPPIPVKAKILVPILILGDLFFGFTSYSIGPIAHFAHIGGALMKYKVKEINLNKLKQYIESKSEKEAKRFYNEFKQNKK